ncbi:MAG: pyridoxal phosphate-dependent aminotransferase [Candidatus Methanofastidiosia archaeon]
MNIYDFADMLSKSRIEIRLDMGQPDLKVPEEILKATKNALNKGKTRYTPSSGIQELKEAIAEKYEKDEENVVVTCGGKFPITATIFHSKKVLIIQPCWSNYLYCLKTFSKKFEIVRTKFEDFWIPNFDVLDKSFDLVIINYPNNPTGVNLPKEKFKELVDLCQDYEIKILSDEVYRDMSFSNTNSILDFDCDSVFVHSFSKTFSMTGFRLGYAISSKEFVKKILKFQQITNTCPADFVQHGALMAFEIYDIVSERVRKIYYERKKVAERTLRNRFEFVPVDGTFYIFPKIPIDSMVFVEKLLKKGVSVFPGKAFGGYNNFFRISLVSERIEKALLRMEEVLCELE